MYLFLFASLVESTIIYFVLSWIVIYFTVIQVVHIAFTYLRLTLKYFDLECKILVKIPDSVLYSALALRGKEEDLGSEKL